MTVCLHLSEAPSKVCENKYPSEKENIMSEGKTIDKYNEVLGSGGFIKLLNIEILELSETSAKGRMPFDAKYCNPGGSMHGGCLYSLADTVAGTLAYSKGFDVTTVDGSMHFLEPAVNTEYIYCTANIKKRGKHLVTCDVEITNDSGDLLDCGIYTFFKLSD